MLLGEQGGVKVGVKAGVEELLFVLVDPPLCENNLVWPVLFWFVWLI